MIPWVKPPLTRLGTTGPISLQTPSTGTVSFKLHRKTLAYLSIDSIWLFRGNNYNVPESHPSILATLKEDRPRQPFVAVESNGRQAKACRRGSRQKLPDGAVAASQGLQKLPPVWRRRVIA